MNISPKLFKFAGPASLAILIAGCMSVQLIADYDEEIDSGASELQHKFSEFFVNYQSAEPEGRAFSANQAFYKGAIADLDALQVRAAAIRKNEITGGQLDAVEMNLALLALLHKNCIDSFTISTEQRQAIIDSGPDASLNCRVDFGATADSPGRGDRTLNPALIPVVKGQFEQALGAVVALEVAKKRGEEE